jgi:hypothetical protein
MPEGVTYRRNSVVMHIRVLEGCQKLCARGEREMGSLVEILAARVRKSRVWAANVDLQRILEGKRFPPGFDCELRLLFLVDTLALLSYTAIP